jgi:regulator of protease activity HflC (stomatin/prohibitin superfamily)
VQEAMTRQMSAERTRRAVVTEAEGAREAAILRAEGEKQAMILEAQGDREAEILRAEAEQRAAVLRYEGLAVGLESLTETARTLDPNTMTLQYLDALKAVGKSRSTKIVVPVELTGLVQQFGQLIAGAQAGVQDGSSQPRFLQDSLSAKNSSMRDHASAADSGS